MVGTLDWYNQQQGLPLIYLLMFGKKQIIISPLKLDSQSRVLRFPNKPPNPESAGKSPTLIQPQPSAHQGLLSLVSSPRSRITPQFSYDLLMAEMELETTEALSAEVATRLFQLYKIGIEHYNTRQNAAKERFFKKKLDALTNHPAVLGMLYAQKQNEDTFYKKKQIERLVEINNKEATESVEHMIKKIENVENSNKQTVERNLTNQMDDIRRRLQKRKLASRPTSTRDDANEQDQYVPPTLHTSKSKISVSMKGSVSFAQPDIKEGENYDAYFVDKYHDDS